MSQPLVDKFGCRVTFDETTGLLWMGLSRCPSNEEFDTIWTIVWTFLCNYPRKCILHLMHVDSDAMDPPSLPFMMHFLSRVVSERKGFKEKVVKIIVQPKVVDEKVMFAQSVFRGLQHDLDVEVTDSAARVEKLLRRAAEKQKSGGAE